MATILRQPDFRPYDPTSNPSRPQSESRESQRKTRRSPNRVKARPANPAIISGIIDSFDTLESPERGIEEEQTSDTISKRSRPPSTNGTIASAQAPSFTRSTSFGVVPEHGASRDHPVEEEVTDAAVPPTVHTSRPPSGLSRYKATRPPSFTSTSANGTRTHRSSSVNSQGSSYSFPSTEKERPAKNRQLSSESWVRPKPAGQDELASNGSLRGRRHLQRRSSRDALKPQRTRIELVPQTTNPPFVSRAESIIAKVSTPPPSGRGRLFLNDSSSEDQSIGTPAPIAEAPELEDFLAEPAGEIPTEDLARVDEDNVEPPTPYSVSENVRSSSGLQTPNRISPSKSPIVDSIPMRTSSLRQLSRSPAPGKKKDRKSKRKGEDAFKTDSVMESNSQGAIPESSWADLGDEDETVKRIRELREKRKSRMLETNVHPPPDDVPVVPATASPVSQAQPMLAPRITEVKQESRARPAAARVSSELSAKARKVLGISDENIVPNTNGLQTVRTNMSLDERRSPVRPLTATSNHSFTPSLSLDYSYAEAIDALHGVEREVKMEPQHTREPSEQYPIQAPIGQTTFIETQSAHTSPIRRHSKLQKPRKNQDRWSHHPDLPLDFEKKRNRRKSTSDAPGARQIDTEIQPPVPRRDSVELAIGEYLRNSRLTHRVKHPMTGRVISFSEVGDPNGAAVFICVGMGLTRYVSTFYDELASTLRLRLITVDRPGVGGSEGFAPTDKSGPLNWPDDVLAVCQYLGISKFSMLAHSAGAIYALATALILPHFIKGKVHLLAPWIPPSQLEAAPSYAASTMVLPRSQRFLRALPAPFLKAANASFMTATSASLKPNTKRGSHPGRPEPRRQQSDGPASRGRDRPSTRDAPAGDFTRRESMMLMDQFMPATNPMENFPIPVTDEERRKSTLQRGSLIMSATAGPMDPQFEYASNALFAAEHTEKVAEDAERARRADYRARLNQRTWELATRDSNPATDLIVCLERHRDVGFRYTDVSSEVVISHGSEDKRVPVANVRWLAERMNRRRLDDSDFEAVEPAEAAQCELRILQGEGHGLMASPSIMGDILTEIAGYWAGPGNKGRATM